MPQKTLVNTFVSIEGCRFWLAWWVVANHAIDLVGGGWLSPSAESFLTNGAAAVNLFVIVSGFVVTHLLLSKEEHYSIYLMRRFLRIAPIYLFCLILAICSEDWFRHVYATLPYSKHIALNLERLAYQSQHWWAYFFIARSIATRSYPGFYS